MNYNILSLSFLLIKYPKSKLLNFDNYFWKLILIKYFNANLKLNKKNYKLDFQIYNNLIKFFFNYIENINNIFKLKNIEIYNNYLYLIPKEIKYLTNLEKFIIPYNKIKILPRELFNLNNLIIIDCACNHIKFISTHIGNLNNLEVLWLSFNKLTKLPTEIGLLLNLSNNNLKNIITEINLLVNLKDFRISQNPELDFIPDISNLENLEILLISKNLFKFIDNKFYNITSRI
jgi:Leucine-rich repeat (LRR) protein